MNGVIKCNAGRVTASGVKWSYLPDGNCAHDLWWVGVLRKIFEVMAWH